MSKWIFIFIFALIAEKALTRNDEEGDDQRKEDEDEDDSGRKQEEDDGNDKEEDDSDEEEDDGDRQKREEIYKQLTPDYDDTNLQNPDWNEVWSGEVHDGQRVELLPLATKKDKSAREEGSHQGDGSDD